MLNEKFPHFFFLLNFANAFNVDVDILMKLCVTSISQLVELFCKQTNFTTCVLLGNFFRIETSIKVTVIS